MAKLVITETTAGVTAFRESMEIEDPSFEEVGLESLSVSGATARALARYLGKDYQDKVTKIEVAGTGVVYEHCSLDEEGPRYLITYQRRR